jgi:PIN domain nuclease of toxin-antitoxin system
MIYLLDTHTVIWSLFKPARLPAKIRTILENPDRDVAVSVLSYWEISLKASLGKLTLPKTSPEEIPQAIAEAGFREQDLKSDHLASYGRLPKSRIHRDPFDRMMVWQAICLKRTLISVDKRLDVYAQDGFKRTWD